MSASNVDNVEYLELTHESLAAQQSHRVLLLDIEARKRAAAIDVPTLPDDVRDALRARGEPIRLFGEDLAAIRDRLRMVIARWEVWAEEREGGVISDSQMHPPPATGGEAAPAPAAEEVAETTYTHALPDLIVARKIMCDYSLKKSRNRLEAERRRRRGMVRWTRSKKRARLFDKEEEDEGSIGIYGEDGLREDAAVVKELDNACEKMYESIRNQALEGSQYGDVRPLSAVCASSALDVGGGSIAGRAPRLIATGGWSGGIKIWNGGGYHFNGSSMDHSDDSGTAPLDLLGAKNVVHEDRIMGVAMRSYLPSITSDEVLTIVASASIDLTAKLCAVRSNEGATPGDGAMDVENPNSDDDRRLRYAVEERAHLRGHAARLCSVAFHPTGRYVATTSFDHTWRLWDVESSSTSPGGTELLLQDGHASEVYGVGFHPDGSLVATTDFGGVVRCWDLRTGRSACHFAGHAGRAVCSEFGPDGFRLATAGDDGTIKVWDMRRRRPSASIPAHAGLVTQLRFAHASDVQNGEFLASSSFDGTGKVWSTRDWRMLTSLRGHEGKVMGIDVLDGPGCGVVTCGFDKTLKLWK